MIERLFTLAVIGVLGLLFLGVGLGLSIEVWSQGLSLGLAIAAQAGVAAAVVFLAGISGGALWAFHEEFVGGGW